MLASLACEATFVWCLKVKNNEQLKLDFAGERHPLLVSANDARNTEFTKQRFEVKATQFTRTKTSIGRFLLYAARAIKWNIHYGH